MIDGTILVVGYLVASAITTTALICACIVNGRADETIEHRQGLHTRGVLLEL